MTRAVTVYASPAQRNRVWQTETFRTEVFTVTVNYRGILDSELITQATASVTYPPTLVISDLAISADQKSVTVKIDANLEGLCTIRIEAQTSGGRTLTQMMLVTVLEAPWVDGEAHASNGPSTLTVSA